MFDPRGKSIDRYVLILPVKLGRHGVPLLRLPLWPQHQFKVNGFSFKAGVTRNVIYDILLMTLSYLLDGAPIITIIRPFLYSPI